MRPQPLIAVRDVEAASRWYQTLLGCRSDHGGPEYERLNDGDELVMQLHHWGVEHDHGEIGDATQPVGNGVLLWFSIEDFDAAVARSEQLGADVVLPVHRNPPDGQPGGPAHRELWIKDLDGYTVVLASPDGSDPLP
jgi:catechol 2,3-dioxygenase-like lactoylglutathione lyase family enzyme